MKKYLLPMLLMTNVVLAATPVVHSDNPEHEWFSEQYSVNGTSCCGKGDGYILESNEWKNVGSHYEVLIEGVWMKIDPLQLRGIQPDYSGNMPLKGTPSPVGKATVWYTHYHDHAADTDNVLVYCFSPYEFMQ